MILKLKRNPCLNFKIRTQTIKYLKFDILENVLKFRLLNWDKNKIIK